MDTLSSAEFRKTYAKLTRATVVTVNGHVIGTWFPGSVADAVNEMESRPGQPPFERIVPIRERYDVRPIRPAPKHR